MALTLAIGRGGTYTYFFCLGKAKKRTACDLPYLLVERVEQQVVGLLAQGW